MAFLPSARLSPTPDLRLFADGHILVGGAPLRLIRLSAAGARLVNDWLAGASVSAAEAHQQLAERLVEQGLLQLTQRQEDSSDPGDTGSDVTIVIPVKDDLDGLEVTLSSLCQHDDVTGHGRPEPLRIVVVDDGSDDPIEAEAVIADLGLPTNSPLSVVRLNPTVGPAAARNHGLVRAQTSRVVFVDAGVEVTPRQIDLMLAELDDPNTVVVAPRVVSRPYRSRTIDDRSADINHRSNRLFARWISHYETRSSPLDLGEISGLVGPGRSVSYLPSTCLAVERAIVGSLNGFDPDLRYGEDVDFVWRAGQHGWCRYLADVVVTHPPRPTLATFVEQRYRYGTSAGPLALRHQNHLAPVSLNIWTTIMWGGLASRSKAGLLAAAAAAAVGRVGLQRSTAHVPQPVTDHLYKRSLTGSGIGLQAAAARPWLPSLLVLVAGHRRRGLATVARSGLVAAMLRRMRLQAPVESLADAALGLVDDLAYSVGVWHGAAKSATTEPLVPRFRSRSSGR